MSKFNPYSQSADLLDEASSWHARISSDDVTVDECEELQEWLATSIKHRLAFESVSCTSQQLESLGAAELELPQGLASTVYECQQLVVAAKNPIPKPRHRHSRLWAIAASLMVALCGALLWQGNWGNDTAVATKDYRTAVGEQRSILLPDGSTMMLNTDTEVAVAITDSDRRILLKSGEAWFDVAKDANRPFTVAVGNGTVRALGTAFNIRHREELVYVTVTEGRVAVKPSSLLQQGGNPQAATLEYDAGKQIIFSENIKQVADLDARTLKQVTVWRHGKLVFNDARLSDIIQEVQPYIRREIIIADQSIAKLMGGGVFNTESASSILKAIEYALPVTIIQRDEVIILTKKAN